MPWKGCSGAKAIDKAIQRTTIPVLSVHFSLSSSHPFSSTGGTLYTLIVTYMYSSFCWKYFLRNKSDAANIFTPVLTEVYW